MATVKKQVELLELKVEELEKTLVHQRELIAMMKDTMMNQKMILEMVISKLNQQQVPPPTVFAPPQEVTIPASTSQAAPDSYGKREFPMNRRVMV